MDTGQIDVLEMESQISSLKDECETLENAREQDQLVFARWEREKEDSENLHQMLQTDIEKLNTER